MLKEAIAKLTLAKDLDLDEAQAAMGEVMDGTATNAQIGAFLATLKLKGETMTEILGCARAMRAKATKVDTGDHDPVDVCGTGGDGAGTFNVSTTSAFVVAAAGVRVAKHGNRSVSSRCGSADVLEALGININLGPHEAELCLRRVGIAFMFAPAYHPAMRHAGTPRKELGIRTVFNLLGPVCNPAMVKAQVVGVYAPQLTELMAQVLVGLKTRHALVVHSLDGLDELSISAPTKVSEVKDGAISEYLVDPGELGFAQVPKDRIAGGRPEVNAAITVSVLKGEESSFRDMVLLNAAAGLLVGGACGDFHEGISIARRSIDSGGAWGKYEEFRDLSRELGGGQGVIHTR